jgi:hypothetical protein
MKVELSTAARDAVRDVLPLVDANKWCKVYDQFYDWAYRDSQHPLKAFEIGQITKFFEQNCGLDILSETKIIPRYFHIADNDILEFIIPNHITFIDYSAFRNCRRLSKVVIPTSIQSIGTETFYGCNDLEYIEYKGTMEQWNLISKDYKWWTRGKIWDARIVKCSDGDVEYD